MTLNMSLPVPDNITIFDKLQLLCMQWKKGNMSTLDVELIQLCNEVISSDLVPACMTDNEILPGFLENLEVFLEKSSQIVELHALTKFDATEDGEFSYSNVSLVQSRLPVLCSAIKKMLLCMPVPLNDNKWTKNITKLCGPFVLKFYFIFGYPLKSWTCEESANCVNCLLKSFLQISNYTTQQQLLNQVDNSVHSACLKLFLPHLTRDNWKRNPAIYNAFKRLTQQLERAALCINLSMILPTILLFIDDYQSHHVVNGLDILHAILITVPAAEIRMYGWAEVIYDTLNKKLYMRQAQIIDNTLPCLLLSLKILERDPRIADHPRQATRYDKTFEVFISCLNTATELTIQKIFWKHAASYINVMGVTILRHLKDLMSAIEYQLDLQDEQLLLIILQTLQALIRVAWMRMKHHSPKLLEQLLKLLLRFDNDSKQRQADTASSLLFQKIRECLALLSCCDGGITVETLKKLQDCPELKNQLNLINAILENCEGDH